jgi:hypothetical protein
MEWIALGIGAVVWLTVFGVAVRVGAIWARRVR